jgi:S-(hydroxymethyl)glutathione dehydrogenase/alcohol dehydrogenase
MGRTPIRAAVLREAGAGLGIEELYLDDPQPGEVAIRTLAAGLCHSDLHYITGSQPIGLPTVLGHEAVGEIVAVGDAKLEHRLGERVVATITPSCGACAQCIKGMPTLCLDTARLRERNAAKLVDSSGKPVNSLGSIGAFAEQFVINANAAIPVDAGIPAAEACLMGCAISTGFGAVVHGAKVSALDTVAVIGCGGIGVAAIQAARIAGARKIIAIDVHREKLDRARAFGATDTILSSERLVSDVQEICPGGVDKSFEAVGSPTTAGMAFSILGPGGTATILGLERPGSQIQLDAAALIEGDRKITGAYMGSSQPSRDIAAFANHRATGALRLADMVTSRWRFDQINDGFAAMAEPQAIRSVIEFQP